MLTGTTHWQPGQQFDIAHVAFLDMIHALVLQLGPAFSKGTMMRAALTTAENLGAIVFAGWDDFLQAVEEMHTPYAEIEGPAEYLGDRMFGLPACPFARSLENYKKVFSSLPTVYEQMTDDLNRPDPGSIKYRTGHGAAVNPFCTIHQTLRSALRVGIGETTAVVYQLGCRSTTGTVGYAERWIAEGGFSRNAVERALARYMCCYGIVLHYPGDS